MSKSDVLATLVLFAYYVIALLVIPSMLKAWSKIPNEVIRKFQHIAYSLSVFILLRLFSTWYLAVGATLLLVVVAYPALYFLERTSFYKKLFVDRSERGGELRRQLLYVQVSFAILIVLFWGLLGVPWQYIVVASVMAWGLGDAAAALIGKFFGKRTIVHRWVEGAKTCEGSTAMMLGAFVAVFFSLLFLSELSWYICLIVALIVAPISAAVELFSKHGTDTLTIPLATAAVVYPLVILFS